MQKFKSVIFAIVGPVGSGKGTVSSYLERHYRARVFKFSTPLREILSILGKEIHRLSLQFLSKTLRDAYGQEVLSSIAKEAILKSESRVSIMDGVRRLPDITPFLELSNFVLIYVDAPVDVRYERIKKRAENAGDSEKTMEQFLFEEQWETEVTIPPLKPYAKYVLDNTQGETELMNQVDRIIEEVLK